ncbi:probable LRR receptor-like serine/threonine-protein kinase At1g56130 isoform X3 [Nymphaea colorata]|uniref:probable LRR receptor-like serine/threonine-protein kinase At1g56130 isoform X3 n=1 Tax=Nymphaea colorata TaxID=210225 RepID=UPI00129D5350|nr:probable LRR receptor-like serine/threonine-protein kinase At1g56130 isoform X3 [Nymphaea colorata]
MRSAKFSESMVSAFVLFLQWILCFVSVVGRGAQAQGQSTTDPVEVSAFRSISKHWNLSSSASWNLTEPCSGTAIDASTIVDTRYDPAIKCSCSNGTCHITKLKVYALSIRGTIPEALANLTLLDDLNLGQNYLTGPLPAFIGNLTSLERLTFGINALSGTVPKELGKLIRLKLLGLGSNNFSGPLPPELGNLVNLQELYIDSAVLSGPIPSTFINLMKLKIVWASDNLFTGKIPDLICNWTELTDLRLEGSFSQGPIPSGFSNLTSMINLRISDLSNGSSSLSFIRNMKSLSTLVLRNVKLSGSIPTDIWSYQELKHLDLSFNNLNGQIPSSLLNMNSLSNLYLGSNLLSGLIPSTKSSNLLNVDLSYNNLSGSLPPWLGENNLKINLVGNSLVIDGSNNSGLPAGLMCLQRDFSCNKNPPIYSSFAIKCGGPQITSSTGIVFDGENEDLGASSYYMINTERWAVSNNGMFLANNNAQFTQNSSSQFTNTLDSNLFQTARLSPVSLRYYGLGLQNGNYTVNLLFAESVFPDSPIWQSVGRRIFDIYVQGNLVLKDFDIRRQAGGVSFRAVSLNFTANVSHNFLEIHLYWAGKGTCCIPAQGTYGPSISAISVTPDFVPTVCNRPPGMCFRKKKATSAVIGISVAAGVVIITFLLVIFVLRQRKRRLHLQNANAELSGTGVKPNIFSYAELQVGTNDFNAANKLGEGGFGPVYQGTLSDGRVVAVKQLSAASLQGKSQFLTEIATISAVKHRNLVKLHGCCLEGDKYLLVYEYLENKSLDQVLFGNKGLNLNWPARFRICLGTARALAYLHEGSGVKIVHRDVKASNILLDAELNPKISDFGMAKLYDDTKSHLSTRVAGTVGYLAPEYAMRGHLTEKADVYGFGVLALEIISGRPNADTSLDQKEIYLLEWCFTILQAWHLHENNSHLKLVDPTLTVYDKEEALRVIRVALLCTQASASLRPRMSRAIAMLSGDIEVSAATSRPAYLTDWHFQDISSTIDTNASTSKMTATTGSDNYQTTPVTTSTITEGSHLPYSDTHTIFQHSRSIGDDDVHEIRF